VLGSNLSWDIGYHDLRFSVAFLTPQADAEVISQLGHDWLLPNPIEFINIILTFDAI
jgi:hypothetical protein